MKTTEFFRSPGLNRWGKRIYVHVGNASAINYLEKILRGNFEGKFYLSSEPSVEVFQYSFSTHNCADGATRDLVEAFGMTMLEESPEVTSGSCYDPNETRPADYYRR